MLPRPILLLSLSAALYAAPAAKIVLIAGTPSHGPGEHEFNNGIPLLAKCLRQNKGVEAVVVTGGWPQDESVFDGARELVFYMDGGVKHAAIQGDRLQTIGRLAAKGVGIACMHYAVEVPAAHGGDEFLEWIGGYYEDKVSKNPINDVMVTQESPDHPISRGWQTFHARDEWYYNIHFRPNDPRLTPLLSIMVPPDNRQKEVVSWVVERADGGRGFGFDGGHFNSNWGNRDFRLMVVNALLWTAKVEVPKGGAQCEIAPGDLTANLDPKPPKIPSHP